MNYKAIAMPTYLISSTELFVRNECSASGVIYNSEDGDTKSVQTGQYKDHEWSTICLAD